MAGQPGQLSGPSEPPLLAPYRGPLSPQGCHDPYVRLAAEHSASYRPPGEPRGAAQGRSQDGSHGYREGECDRAMSGHRVAGVVSITCVCQANHLSGFKQLIIPPHGSEGSQTQLASSPSCSLGCCCQGSVWASSEDSTGPDIRGYSHPQLELMLDAQLGLTARQPTPGLSMWLCPAQRLGLTREHPESKRFKRFRQKLERFL